MLKRHAYSYPFVLAVVLAAAFVVTNGNAATDVKASALSRLASEIVPRTSVYVHRFGDMTAGEAVRYEDGSNWIGLAPDVVARLRDRRVLAPSYPRASTGFAVFVLTHEIGHVQGRPAGQWEEARADCYASRHWRGVALRLGFTRAQLPALARQIDGGVGAGTCWGPEADL